MGSSSTLPVTPPTLYHLFGMSPVIRKGSDGSLVLARSLANRMMLIICVAVLFMGAVLLIYGILSYGEWTLVLPIVYLLLVMWLPWSVVSVTFDKNERTMRVRRSLYPLRPIRDRPLADLRAVLVVKFRKLRVGHIRLVFGETSPQTVQLAAFWSPGIARSFANELSEFLGVPLEEVTYAGKRGLTESKNN